MHVFALFAHLLNFNIPSLPKIRYAVCQNFQVNPPAFQVYCPCSHVAHRNTRVNGANFIEDRHKTRVNTLKS